ncbi:putative ABC exporter domain-containing protein [Desulfotomaculum sp. 1211_IL3151]|uniref:putative ABC exporter domain-containing protein n=1 Tax=Desulfotomaculum sp. 1211_IL3151 TaxID=3084055 RepID=UPI002FDA46F6
MNDFKLLIKRDGWIIKNHFVEIKHNPKRLIIYFFYLFWLGSLLFNVLLKQREPMPIPMQFSEQILGAAFVGFSAVFILYFLYRGTTESSTFFSMGDVHLLFPSPVSPKKILLYSMTKQSLVNFFLYGIVILALMPTITNLAKINPDHLPFLYLGYIGMVLSIKPLNFLIFAIGSKYRIQSWLQQGILFLSFIFIAYLGIRVFTAEDLLQGVLQGLNAPFINYLPVIGWSKVVFMTAVTGYSTFSAAALVLQILFLICCIALSYYTADDYYEDTLKATEKRSLHRRRKKGMEKSQPMSLPFLKNKNVIVKKAGTGPWTFLWRSKIEASRSDLHPYLGFRTLIFLLAGLIIGYFSAGHNGGITPLYVANGVIAYLLFIFSASNSGQSELTKPYIYLIPGSNLLKIICSNLTDVLRMTVNIAALNIPLGIMLKAPVYVIAIMIVFGISFYILNLCSNYLSRILFPSAIDQKALYPLFLMLQVLLLLLPGGIVGGALAVIYHNILLAFVGIGIVNIVIIGILLLLSNRIFAKLEWK